MRSMAICRAGVAVLSLMAVGGCLQSSDDGRFAGVEGAGARGDATLNVPAVPSPKVSVKRVPAPAGKPAPAAPARAPETPVPGAAETAPAQSETPADTPGAASSATPGKPVAPPFAGLTTSQEVVDILKEAEGLRLDSYQDGAGNWFIGYGHARTAGPGMTITQSEAEALLREDLESFEAAVRKSVTVPVTAGEFSALTYFAYTIGTGAFAKSSVVRLLNEGDRAGAADAFLLWTKVRRDGELVESPGLVKLRQKQRALFLGEAI